MSCAEQHRFHGRWSACRPEFTGLAADQLKAHVNQQAELKGRKTAQAQGALSGAQEFSASSVKMVNATCPAAK
jgi:hypothetical protein